MLWCCGLRTPGENLLSCIPMAVRLSSCFRGKYFLNVVSTSLCYFFWLVQTQANNTASLRIIDVPSWKRPIRIIESNWLPDSSFDALCLILFLGQNGALEILPGWRWCSHLQTQILSLPPAGTHELFFCVLRAPIASQRWQRDHLVSKGSQFGRGKWGKEC